MSRINNQRKKIFASPAGWFSFLYPIDWEVEEDEFVTVYDPEGVGAIYISSYQAPKPVDPSEELLEHLSQENPATRLEDIETSVQANKTMASFETLDERCFRKVWFVAHGSYLVIVTYTSAAEDRKIEISDVEEIVGSIEIRSKLSRN